MFINHIEGKIVNKSPTCVIIESGGIGYRVKIPISTYEHIASDSEKLFITMLYRNESFEMYGFYTEDEREYFESLIKVRGIGGETALRILSSVGFEEFKETVDMGDVNLLSTIKGIGRKRAENIIFELKGLFKEDELSKDAISALVTLGFTRNEARKAISLVRKGCPGADVETLVKKALNLAR